MKSTDSAKYIIFKCAYGWVSSVTKAKAIYNPAKVIPKNDPIQLNHLVAFLSWKNIHMIEKKIKQQTANDIKIILYKIREIVFEIPLYAIK